MRTGLHAWRSALLLTVALAPSAMAQTVAEGGGDVSDAQPSTPSPPLVQDINSLSQEEIFRRMFGKERPPVIAGRYAVVLDGMNAGEALIDPSGDGWIDGPFVKRLVSSVLLPESMAGFEAISNSPRVSFNTLRDFGLSVDFDQGQLVLMLGIPMSIRTAMILPLNPPRVASSVEFIEQADISSYLSVRGGVDLIEKSNTDTGFSGLAADFDFVLNVKGVVAQSRFRYDKDARKPWFRGDTRITYDDVDSLVRYEAGDLSVARRPYQLAPRIAGLAAFREYRINPYLNFRASPERGFEIESSSRIEVLVNGSPIRTFSLSPGRYLLRDLPLVTSATNDVQIRITSASGQQEVVSFPAFAAIDLLQPGRNEFAMNVGVPYRDSDGVRDYITDNFNVMGFYRRGISQTLTLGGSIEADKNIAVIGTEVAWASPFGTFDFNAAMDVRNAGLSSSRLSMQYAWRDADLDRGRGIDAIVVLTGEDFRTLDGIFGSAPSSIYAQVRMGQALSRDLRVQLGGTFERVRDPEPGDRWSVGASVLKQLKRMSIGASLDYQQDRGRSEAIARVSMFIPLGSGALAANYSSRDNAARIEYNQVAAAGVGSFGYNLGIERRDGGDRQFARASYVGNRFEATIDQSRTSSNGSSDIRTGFAVGSALVMADGAFALSRPITNSFAIVENASDVKTRLAVEPRSGLGAMDVRYSAFSGTLGPAVVPDLPPYFERPIEVNAPDAPAGSGIGGDVFNLRPGFRSGYRLRVGAGQGSVSALGILNSKSGAPIGLVSGEVRKAGADPESPPGILFTNSAGRFIVEGLEAGASYEAIVTVEGKPVRFDITVPTEAMGIWRPDQPIVLDVEINDAKE